MSDDLKEQLENWESTRGFSDVPTPLLRESAARIATLEAQLKTAGEMIAALTARADAQVARIATLEARCKELEEQNTAMGEVIEAAKELKEWAVYDKHDRASIGPGKWQPFLDALSRLAKERMCKEGSS